MGTKIHANAFLHEYHSMIDLHGSTSNGMRPLYHKNQLQNHDSFTSYDLEKVRRTVLEHESIFRNQLQELHRLYGRQRELMNDIRRREINKDDVKVEKCHSSYLFSQNTREDAKGTSWNPYPSSSSTHSMISSRLYPSLRSCDYPNGTFNLGSPWQLQERFSKLPVVESTSEKRNILQASYDGDNRFSVSGVQTSQHKTDGLTFDLYFNRNNNAGGSSMTNPCSNFNLETKDFFQTSGKEQLSDHYAEKRRFNKHSFAGDFGSGKPPAFAHSLLTEPKEEYSNRPSDVVASVSRKRKKIFGVEISEENDPFGATFNTSSNLDKKARPPFSLNSSSWIANSFMQKLDAFEANPYDGKNERSKTDLKGELFSDHSDTKGKWLEDCSSLGLNLVEEPYQHNPKKYFKNVDNMRIPTEVLKKDSEHHIVLEDRQNNEQNPKGGLPWFLRNSQVGSDVNKENKSSYFMNLDSLKNHSQKFFGKAETPDGTIQTSKAAQNAEVGINEVNDCARKAETHTGLNNHISDLRHCIDLNLSLNEEDVPFTPSLPTAVVKIATTEIDLEAETDASLKDVESKKTDMQTEKSGLTLDEHDKTAAEAIIAISLSTEKESVDENSLKWFAEIASKNLSQDCDEEEDSIPDGMDYFEFMTLKLEDTKEEHYHYEPFMLNIPSDDETGATQAKRSRRGQSRRGRQRKDFQRDILPSMVTLGRLEVTEDFQAFEELLKAEGSTWQSGLLQRTSSRNVRGRKRLGGGSTSPMAKTLCSTQAQQPICQLEDRSLTGWGKKTRRLPRQRCPNALLSFPVKC